MPEASHPDVADAEPPRPPCGPGAGSHNADRRGNQPLEVAIDGGFVVRRIDRENGGLPAERLQVTGDEPHALRRRQAARRKIRADDQDSTHATEPGAARGFGRARLTTSRNVR
jgi:hypothetical protein